MENKKCLKPPTRLRIMTKDLFKFGRIINVVPQKNGRFMAGVPMGSHMNLLRQAGHHPSNGTSQQSLY